MTVVRVSAFVGGLLLLVPGIAQAACTVGNPTPPSGTVAVNSPRFRWSGSPDCATYRVQWSPSGTFVGDTISSGWVAPKSLTLAESVWETRQTGVWAGGVTWRVQGRDAAGVIVTSPTRTMTMDPDLDDDGTSVATDCDDTDPTIEPGVLDDCNGIDNDCDGAIDDAGATIWAYVDADLDGYGDDAHGASFLCEAPVGFVEAGGDCDDGVSWIHPAAAEVCDGFDNDCSTVADDGLSCPTYCDLSWTCDAAVETGDPTPFYNAVIYAPGVTEGAGAGVVVDLGYGPDGTSPGSEDWTWYESPYAGDSDGLFPGDAANDVYGTSFTAPEDAASYDVAARVSGDGGATWMFCDAGPTCGGSGSDDGYNAPVSLEVSAPEPIPVDYCHVQWPCSIGGAASSTSENIYVVVYEGGVTPGDGEGPGLWVQVGHGAVGEAPESGGWSWWDAGYNASVHGLTWGDYANDEYAGALVYPAVPGTYQYGARVSADEGLSWLACDLGPSCGGNGSSDGFSSGGTCTAW